MSDKEKAILLKPCSISTFNNIGSTSNVYNKAIHLSFDVPNKTNVNADIIELGYSRFNFDFKEERSLGIYEENYIKNFILFETGVSPPFGLV
ncbi:MAG: hypothetical protein MI922_00440 [Bacteroidales bacterium]|nr:hypothetical protein [Bacteroidales bacterium]